LSPSSPLPSSPSPSPLTPPLQVVDSKILCVHGGLSPDVRTLDQIRTISRAQEIPQNGPLCDLMWSDPEDIETWQVTFLFLSFFISLLLLKIKKILNI
jgi:hypothetical protein